jgi:hypothetical protein
MAMAYESKKNSMVAKREDQFIKKNSFAEVHCLEMLQHYLRLQNIKVYTYNVWMTYLEIKTQVSAKPFWGHDILALMKEDLIHNVGHGNVVPYVLNRQQKI